MTFRRHSAKISFDLPSRHLPPGSDQYFFGYSKQGKPDGRVIVLDENRPHFAREYTIRHSDRYYCLGCTPKHYLTAHFTPEDGLTVPNDKLHSEECELRALKDILAQQDRYKAMFGFRKPGTQFDKENEMPVEGDYDALEPIPPQVNGTPPPPAKKIRIEANVYFSSPSSFWLRRAVERLKLPYFPAALLKWAEIDIDRVSPFATVDKTFTLDGTSNTGFRSLALLLLGDEKLFSLIQAALISMSFNKLTIKASNATQCAENLHFLCSADLTDDVFNLLSGLLDCRIGIFNDNQLHTFGVWKDEANGRERVTILLKESNGSFLPVKTISN
uniref:Competence protein CoiA-like family, contains a predicted nuclease domain n=1 Tax=Panagrellus redivivus TaxID=6233 RepID=A0A7E4VHT4_PANRE